VINRTAELGGEDTERLAGRVLLVHARLPAFGLVAGAQVETSRLAEGPAQVGVADLLVAEALRFARGLVRGSDEARVRQEVAGLGEACDVVDFVKERQAKDFADTGDGLQPGVGLRIVDLGGADQVQLEVVDLRVECVDEGEVALDELLRARIGEAFGKVELGAVGGIDELLVERRRTRNERRRSRSRVARIALG